VIFTTENSTYEIDHDQRRIRRLHGAYEPTRHFGEDSVWCYYESISSVIRGMRVCIEWDQDGNTTTTSRVVDVAQEAGSHPHPFEDWVDHGGEG